MSSKLYLVFAIVFVIFGVTLQATSVEEDQVRISENAIIDAIKKLIDQLSNVEKEAIKQLSNAIDKLNDFVNDTLTKFSKEISSTIGKYVEGIVALANEAIKLGVNITQCAVDESVAEIKNIPETFLNATINCTDAVFYSAGEYVGQAAHKLNDTINGVKDLLQEASKCGLNPLCWAKLDVKLVEKAATVPVEIAAIVTDTLKLITKLNIEASKCYSNYAAEAVGEAVSITKNVTTCIHDAIKNK